MSAVLLKDYILQRECYIAGASDYTQAPNPGVVGSSRLDILNYEINRVWGFGGGWGFPKQWP